VGERVSEQRTDSGDERRVRELEDSCPQLELTETALEHALTIRMGTLLAEHTPRHRHRCAHCRLHARRRVTVGESGEERVEEGG